MNKARLFIIMVVLLLSLGLVTVVLAAAGSTRATIVPQREAVPQVADTPLTSAETTATEEDFTTAPEAAAGPTAAAQAVKGEVDRAEIWMNTSGSSNMWGEAQPGTTVIDYANIPFQSPDLIMNVNYGHDWIEGNYEAGHTVWLTVTESDGFTVKGIAALTTGWLPYWGDQTGFSTNWQGWEGDQPDIMPGDWIYGLVDNGYTSTVRMGTINGELDMNADTVSGTIHADWFTQPLDANCGVWEENGPGYDFTVDPDGGSYICDFSAEWDLIPGQQVGVQYQEPDGDWVINVFEYPAPELWIEKQTTPGVARPGGTYLYYIRYGNNGSGAAENTIITDTLPTSTTYFADTSGFPVVDGGNVITWTLGDVPPGNDAEFYVSLIVDSGVPTQTNLDDNCAGITTTSEGDNDMDNNQACSGGAWVDDGDWGLWVDKWPEPNDPHPGQTFQYIIEYGSDGSAATGPVWLTDTLPAGTTFVSWEEEHVWGALWTEVITTGSQFVLYAPAGIPGDMGGRIRLTLLLDGGVPISTTLENTVVITTAGDVDSNNNWDYDNEAHVSPARYDMRLDKDFQNGVLVPGGWVQYGIYYNNQGNIATQAWVTDTLPPGTSYQPGSAWDYNGQPFPPINVTTGYVVWDLGVVGVNDGFGFGFTLDVSSTVSTGTIINCATVGITAIESTPGDNTDCVTETINDPGPNLRVTKWHNWNGDSQLGYEIRFENISKQTISDVWITDTLPADTTWDGWWDMGFYWDRLISDTQSSSELRWQFSELYPGDSGWLYFNADLVDSNARPRWYTNTVEIDKPPGDVNPGDNTYEDVVILGEVDSVDVWVDTENSNMWGEAQDGAVVTVTTPLTQVYGWADPGCGGCWDIGDAGPVWPGDVIVVEAGAGLLPVVINVPDPFTAEADSIIDQVWGQIGGAINEMVEVDGYWPGGHQEVNTDGSGNYLATYANVPRGGSGEVRYRTVIDYADVTFHRVFQTMDLVLQVNYDNDGVDGNYEPGHTGWITVTESDGVTIKATVEIETAAWPGWGGGTGFSTHHHQWYPQNPDIVPGDWVYGLMDNGESTQVQVGEITGYVDSANDSITGTVDAAWLMPDFVDVECHTWGAPWWAPNAQNKNDSVLPNGADPYACSWDPVNEWDVEPGQDIGVIYTEPDSRNQVSHGFHEPAPYLRIEKWANADPGEGGNFSFYVQYVNQGDADAEDVVISDTLLGGMNYITDTSGLPHTGSGSGPIVWDVGTLPPGDWIQFEVFAEITASAGERITNTAEIATSNPYDQGEPGEKYAEWWSEVQPNDTHLNVRKWAWTGDPAPGYEFVWGVNVCNDGSTGSSEVIVTDTLPISTTLVDWWGQNPGWTEVSQDAAQLVVSRPSIQGWSCGEVYLRFLLDSAAWPGLDISNTVTISASNDMESDDNQTEDWVWVNDPHTNLNVSKDWSWGQLVPGGEIRYWIDYGNNGNVPVSNVVITDTLPESTSLLQIRAYDHNWNDLGPVTPTVETADYVVWEVGPVDNGDWGYYEIRLQVDKDATPGTVLTNTVEISPQPDEDDYDDNSDTVVETLFDHGPNLRIRKDGQWDDWGEGTRRASYWINVENVGDAPVMPVVITDTYDTRMYLDGGVGVDYWQWWDWQDDPASHSFTVTLESLYGGESVGINFGTITDTEPLPFGLIFTNTAEVTLDPSDTNPGDNVDQVILTTGPDLYVEKTLVAGDLLPGEIITFSLRFGNDHFGHEWWWNMQGDAWLTDTLPAGMEFVTATQQSCGWCASPPNVSGNQYGWQLWPFGAGEWDEIHLTVRITDTAEGDDVFTNWVEIASTQPVSDNEPYYDNNVASFDVVIAQPKFEVGKVYESSRVAGTVVTYTLTVTNLGSEAGTTVVLSDTLPAGLTYGGSDGTWDGTNVTWNFASIAPNGGTATGWFSATLPCTGTVTNAQYRVVSSDQGVTSPDGSPVSFSILAPTITVGFVHGPAYIVAGDTVYFTATASTNGTPLTYEWDFDDGPTGTGLTTSHDYTADGGYTVVFTATDTCGYSDVQTATVTVNVPALVASFNQSATSVVAGTTVYFTDTTTTDRPPITAWAWDFGDASAPASTQDTSHPYNTAGTYTVTLVVTDSLGYSDEHTSIVTVNVPALVANFNQSATSVVAGTTVYFTDTSTTDGPPITAWAWDFGDGSAPASTQDTSHAYNTAGTYTVTLVVTDSLGYSHEHTATVTVNVPALVASFSQSATSVVAGTTVYFTDTSTTDGPPITAWAWDFGDGSAPASTQDTSHTYNTAGTYTVTLVVTDSLGYSDEKVKANLVTVSKIEFQIYLPVIFR